MNHDHSTQYMEEGSPTRVLDRILMDPFILWCQHDVNCTLPNLSYTRGGFHYLAPSTGVSSPGVTGDPKWGLPRRVVAEHAMNADSSRSHMVFTVRLNVEGCEKPRKLTFCDLGGCERRQMGTVCIDGFIFFWEKCGESKGQKLFFLNKGFFA